MSHRPNGKPLSRRERYRFRAVIEQRVATDIGIRSLDELAAALSTSTKRIVEAMGPQIGTVSATLKRRRPVATDDGERRRRHPWYIHKQQSSKGRVPEAVVVLEDFDAFLREVAV